MAEIIPLFTDTFAFTISKLSYSCLNIFIIDSFSPMPTPGRDPVTPFHCCGLYSRKVKRPTLQLVPISIVPLRFMERHEFTKTGDLVEVLAVMVMK